MTSTKEATAAGECKVSVSVMKPIWKHNYDNYDRTHRFERKKTPKA